MMYRGRQHERDFREIGAASATASANRFGPDQSFISAAPTPQGPHWPAEHRTMESPRTADRPPFPAPQRRGGLRHGRDTRPRLDGWWRSGPSLRRRTSQRRRGSAPQTVRSIDRSSAAHCRTGHRPSERGRTSKRTDRQGELAKALKQRRRGLREGILVLRQSTRRQQGPEIRRRLRVKQSKA
jgi:hypothetical protein